MRKTNKQQGFTLIELMIVVAVIGVLAAVALPQYQKYVAKSETANALASLSGLKTTAETHTLENGVFPSSGDITNISGALGVISVKAGVSGAGDILFNFNPSGVSPEIIGKQVRLNRNSDGTWSCKSNITEKSSLPKTCESSQPKIN